MAQIEFSEEQNMLLDTAGEFCKTHASIELVRAGIEDDTSVKSEVWKEMADLGWMGIIVPEEYGGLGLGLSDVVPIVESMGRNLMGSPYTSNVLAAQALGRGWGRRCRRASPSQWRPLTAVQRQAQDQSSSGRVRDRTIFQV